jgi:cytochrome c biogenesis protein CcmG/thiol:disulfide interchange protein DsbE
MKPGAAPLSPLSRRALLLAPFGVAAAFGAGSWLLLERPRGQPDYPPQVPSPLVGKPVPAFSLPGQPPGRGFSSADVRATGRPILINFFASWCMPCAQEAPVLRALKQQGVPVWGIAYKDAPAATGAFLHDGSDPYTSVARDEAGTVGDAFGLSGVPETFAIDKSGIVRWHWAGALSEALVHRSLEPMLRSLA